eukprot:2393666-Amphidinium_carterae.2
MELTQNALKLLSLKGHRLAEIDRALVESDRVLNQVVTCRHYLAKYSEAVARPVHQARTQQNQTRAQQGSPIPQQQPDQPDVDAATDRGAGVD